MPLAATRPCLRESSNGGVKGRLFVEVMEKGSFRKNRAEKVGTDSPFHDRYRKRHSREEGNLWGGRQDEDKNRLLKLEVNGCWRAGGSITNTITLEEEREFYH